MAKKSYVVFKGRKPGIYHSWPDCLAQVHQFPGARYKGFASLAEAQAAFDSGASPAPAVKKPATSKPLPAKGNSKFARITGSEQIEEVMAPVQIYTDGACEPNPGEAGSGIAVYRDRKLTELWYGLYEPMGTNQTAELNALYQALLLAEPHITDGRRCAILSDSSYSLNCMAVWSMGWKKAGWTRKGNAEIKNLELIQPLHELYQKLAKSLDLFHVKAHIGIEGNELADRMSVLARTEATVEFCRYPDLDIEQVLKLSADAV